MNARVAAGSTVAVVGLSFFVAWLFELPLERALVLSPAIVIATGLLAMVMLLLLRGAIESARELKHPRRFWIGLAIACVVIAVLTFLGVELPREGGGY